MKSKISLLLLVSFIVSMSFGQIPTRGLVLYLPLDGNADDLSGYANNGLNKAAIPSIDRFGRANKSLYFNGSSSVVVPSTKNIELGNNKTLSCWVYVPSNVTQNMYPTLIHKDEPLMSTTYSIFLTEYYGYYSNQYKFDFIFASNYTHYQVYTKQLYTNSKDTWLHIASTYDSISGYSKIYYNGAISDSLYVGNKTAHVSNSSLYIGTGKGSNNYFKGNIDEVRLYNRALNKNEIYQLYVEGTCSNITKNDTTTYYIYNESFKVLSPQFQLMKTDSLKTKINNCDSIIKHYAKFEYSIATNTLPVSTTQNIVNIYPNPAKDNITISFGDYAKTSGYFMVIRNVLGKAVYSAPIIQEFTNLSVKELSGSGVYIVQLFDNQSTLVGTRKILFK